MQGKLLDDVNKIIRETPWFRYAWPIALAKAGGGVGVYDRVIKVDKKIDNVEKGLNEKIYNVEVQVERVEKGLNEKIHSLEVKLKDELHDQLGQMRASMERREDKLSAEIEKTNETLAQLLKRLS